MVAAYLARRYYEFRGSWAAAGPVTKLFMSTATQVVDSSAVSTRAITTIAKVQKEPNFNFQKMATFFNLIHNKAKHQAHAQTELIAEEHCIPETEKRIIDQVVPHW